MPISGMKNRPQVGSGHEEKIQSQKYLNALHYGCPYVDWLIDWRDVVGEG